MNAMIAAAQQHMQKNLTSKLLSIGVPISRFGIPNQSSSSTVTTITTSNETESIPLPGDPMGVDMDIADIPAPPMPNIHNQDIPLPPVAHADSDKPPGEYDCAPPGEDNAPPGRTNQY